MDLYLTSAEPGLTLQEMIDCDIKGGMDFESGFPSGEALPFDFGAMTGLDSEELDIKTFEPLFDPLEEEEVHEMGNPRVPTGGESSPMASWMNLSAMTNFNLDIETSVMVNPSDVLPSPHYTQSKRHRVTPPPIISIKKEPQFQELQRLHNRINSHPSSPVTTQVVLQPITTTTTTTTPQSPMDSTPTSGITQNLVITNSPSASHRHITTTSAPVHTTLQLNTNGVSSVTPTATSAISVYQPNLRQTSSLPFTPNRTKPLPKYPRRERTPEEKSYPKPAYSYACLIALALKNSITGSLPVSEIYSFMCEHFPYFRTAPNGWKNSVRHNLSLNKCFEKIEKPVVSGSNQRKGCLWALNPMKAHKMDEEVQKWSKKDLQGIRDAMTCPEVLESLEKGEMKFEATSGASSCSEDEEEEEGISEPVFLTEHHQQTIAPIKVISSTPVGITQSINVHSHQNGFRSSPNSNLQREPNTNTAISSSHGHPQQVVRTLSSSPEPEYILPDSTMPEINIQSNGSLIDDFGNEITLDGDLSILNPRGGSVQSSGANLILRKVNASPLRNSSIRSNFVYTTSSSANLIPHQNGMNRLVLTNTKLSS